jgi:hypothetical protein
MIENFFQELFAAYERQKAYHDERVKNGDYFNVFNVLRLSSNETRTHSAFIAELLNPYGTHGMGNFFLRKFISHMQIRNLQLDLSKAYIEVERVIGDIDENYDNGGRIDIIVEDGKKAIIIENKIYAQDQYKQLVRYNNYAKGNFADYRLLYLTLNKDSASEASTQDNKSQLLPNEDYFPITYREDIIDWLEDCIDELSSNIVRVIIQQYIDLLKQLTYQMEENNIVLDVLKKDENLACTLEVLKNAGAWKESLWNEFADILKEKVEGKGWILRNNGIGDISVYTNENAEYYINMTKAGGGTFIGITSETPQEPKECLSCLSWPESGWPFGWKFLERGYQHFLPLSDWNSWEYLFPENRNDFIDYLMQEITTIMKDAMIAGINI